jgi:hypothetical protein
MDTGLVTIQICYREYPPSNLGSWWFIQMFPAACWSSLAGWQEMGRQGRLLEEDGPRDPKGGGSGGRAAVHGPAIRRPKDRQTQERRAQTWHRASVEAVQTFFVVLTENANAWKFPRRLWGKQNQTNISIEPFRSILNHSKSRNLEKAGFDAS